MKDLAWATAVAVVAALCGWMWQAGRRADPPTPVAIGSGASIGGPGSAASGSPSPTSRFPVLGSASGSASGSWPGPRGTRAQSDHEQVTIAHPKRVARVGGGYEVNFPYLASFRALIPDPTSAKRGLVSAPIPAGIMELDGAEVELRGFTMPLVVEQQRMLEFLLLRYSYDQCCFGKVPEPNEWVVVKVPPERAIGLVSEGTVIATGRFSVGPEYNEAGEMVSLYRLAAIKVEVAR